MRNSTPIADSMPARDFLGVLNDYFECAAGAVMANGGEVLRFVGDAVLAIFPIGDDGTTVGKACEAAMAAANEAAARMVEVNRRRGAAGGVPLAFGLGLHVGDVLYGNIGVPERLEFSVIGRAANEAARIESMTKELGHDVLASRDFASRAPDAWTSLGEHRLKGVGEPFEIFAMARKAAGKDAE